MNSRILDDEIKAFRYACEQFSTVILESEIRSQTNPNRSYIYMYTIYIRKDNQIYNISFFKSLYSNPFALNNDTEKFQ